jgi:hypothetical protein
MLFGNPIKQSGLEMAGSLELSGLSQDKRTVLTPLDKRIQR